jgi:glycosyltransferase involved in cell wall biosynthesis
LLSSSADHSSDSPISISVVVPLQDEEHTIEDLLRSLAAQTHPADEIVLVDAGSRDKTVSRAMGFAEDLPIQVVATGRVHPGVARNTGVTAAKEDWIAFTDAGVVLDAGWLAALALRAANTDVVYGNYEPLCDSYFRQCAAIAYVSAKDETGTRGPSIASCLIRREAFRNAGGFPSFRAAEDLVFIHRLAEVGARAAFAPNAIVRWQIAGTATATFKRFATYSYHNLVAGWWRHWHLGTARLYVGLTVVVVAVAYLGAVGWILPVLVSFFAARALKAAFRKRNSFEFNSLAAHLIGGAAAILVVIDFATLVGFLRWVTARGPVDR